MVKSEMQAQKWKKESKNEMVKQNALSINGSYW